MNSGPWGLQALFGLLYNSSPWIGLWAGRYIALVAQMDRAHGYEP